MTSKNINKKFDSDKEGFGKSKEKIDIGAQRLSIVRDTEFKEYIFGLCGFKSDDEFNTLKEVKYDSLYLFDLINEVDDPEILEGKDLNRYIYLVIRYNSQLKEKNPVKAQKIQSLLTKLAQKDNGANLELRIILVQTEIQKYFYNGNYKDINNKFDSYIDIFNNIMDDFPEENDTITAEKIFKLDLLTFLLVNFILCIFDKNTLQKVNELKEKLLKLLDKYSLLKHSVILREITLKNELERGEYKPETDLKDIEKDVNLVENTNYKLKINSFSVKERYQLMILKLEILINNKANNSEIESLIKEIEKQEERDFDLEIHFEYLKVLYYISKKIGSVEGILDKVSDDTNTILEGKGVENRDGIEMLEKILEKYSTIENKLFLFKTLILLVKLEENKDKKIKYFFKAMKYVKKHFGDISNFYMDELIIIGKDLFPDYNEEVLNMQYELHFYRKNAKRDELAISKQLDNNATYDDLGELLRKHFGVVEVFIYELDGDDIRYSSGFNKEIGAVDGSSRLNQKEVLNQVNEQTWTKIKITPDSIKEIINDDYFSETLIGKIIKIGEHKKVFVCLAKGSKNNTCLSEEQLKKIEFQYLRKRLSDDIATADSQRKIKIEKLYKELTSLMETITQLTGGTFHDINGKLFSLSGNCFLLELDWEDFKKGEISIDGMEEKFLNFININKTSVNELEALSREGSRILKSDGEFVINKVYLDINKLINGICDSYNSVIKNTGKNIKIIFNHYGELKVKLDGDKIKRVINNILSNAIKFIENTGIIKINTKIKNNLLNIEIEDDGIGLEKGDLKKIFKFAVQVGTEEQKRKGTGLGLYNCDLIVKAHDGEIYASSEGKGKGTKFIINIPVENNIIKL